MAEKAKSARRRKPGDPRGCPACGPYIGRHRRLLRTRADEDHSWTPRRRVKVAVTSVEDAPKEA